MTTTPAVSKPVAEERLADLREECARNHMGAAAFDEDDGDRKITAYWCERLASIDALISARTRLALLDGAREALEAGASAIVWSGQHEEIDVHHAELLRRLAGGE